MAKKLLFGDLHAHNFREFSTIEGDVNTRLKDCVEVVLKIKGFCDKENVDEVWFFGDCFHLKNNLSSEVVKLVMDAFNELLKDRSLLAIPGNHDFVSWTSNPILLKLFHQYLPERRFTLVSSFGWIKGEDKIYVEPFTRKVKELNKRIAELKTNPEQDIFFGHQDMIGVRYGGFVVEHGLDADMLSKKFKWSFVGHWHIPGKVRENVISIGAPIQHNFGDVNQPKGWWIFDSEKGEIRLIQNDFSPRFFDIKVGPESIESPGDPSKDFYRIKVRGELPEFLNKLRWKRVSREVEGETKKRTTISFSDKKEDIVEKYVEARGGDLGHKKLVEMGRKYL